MLATPRCVYLCVDNLDPTIQSFREQHDPLGKLIEPHITLVFPFESRATDSELVGHVAEHATSTQRFEASIEATPTRHGEYIYFAVTKGAANICELHDRLYKGVLQPLLLDILYVPHITVARSTDRHAERLLRDVSSLKIQRNFKISTVKIERILEDGRSELIKEISLGQDPSVS